MNKELSIFYACDDAFVKYTIVSLSSMIKNASKDYNYKIYILTTNISQEMKMKLLELENENFKIEFVDVSNYLESISNKLPIRDYYSKTTYYRLFISEMFLDLDKALYIDSDTIVQGDISELFNIDILDNYLGACHEQVMVQVDEYGTYVEKVIGISRYNFFNAGLILINCHQFREHKVLDKFIYYLGEYNFQVTQDEDYLNLICKDHIYWLDDRWNCEVFGNINYPIEEAKIIHYIMVNKPWHYKDCRFGNIFWKYAEKTNVYLDILNVLNSYSEEAKINDQISCENLLKLAVKETNREDNFLNLSNLKKAKDRVEILKKMELYEYEGRFDEDLEEDPPSKQLLPDDIDYLRNSLIAKMKTKFAYMMARKFLNKIIKEKQMIIKEIKGLENFKNLTSGAIITCNHFNAFDSFAVQVLYEAAKHKNRKFYRVIREGNYTSFPGFYGMLMRNCNTLPLSSNLATMKKFLKSVDILLKKGHFVLVYPEQSLWWNYRKPKPLKDGAFNLAVKSNVPVLPCFITMKDSDIKGEDGFFIQEYTITVGEPIYVEKNKSHKENIEIMKEKNYNLWKDIYEKEYQMPLYYNTKDEYINN